MPYSQQDLITYASHVASDLRHELRLKYPQSLVDDIVHILSNSLSDNLPKEAQLKHEYHDYPKAKYPDTPKWKSEVYPEFEYNAHVEHAKQEPYKWYEEAPYMSEEVIEYVKSKWGVSSSTAADKFYGWSTVPINKTDIQYAYSKAPGYGPVTYGTKLYDSELKTLNELAEQHKSDGSDLPDIEF